MALILKRLYTGYFWLFDEVADPRASDYFLMSSPLPLMIIHYFYFKFIYNWGPRYMENRQPLNLKNILIVYNIVQIAINLYLVYEAITAMFLRREFNFRCAEIDWTEDGRHMLNLVYLYYMTKVLDLLDTVFFVLRKKHNQVSFLHVYHHFGMTGITWIGVKFLGGGHSIYLGAVNVVVHAVMYSYYLLTVLSDEYKKKLWLKKFITQIQLAQFVFLLYAYGQLLFNPDCNYPKIAVVFFVPQNLFMIILFSDFYYRAYIRKKPQKLQVKNGIKSE